DGRRCALDGGALQVVEHTALAAHFLAAARAAGAAMHEHRHRGAVAGAFLGALGIEHQDAAVHERGAQHKVLRDGIVGRDDGAYERALAHLRQRDRIVQLVVWHDGAHRSECLDVVHIRLFERIIVEEYDRRDERALVLVRALHFKFFKVADHDSLAPRQLGDALAHFLLLTESRQRPHAHAFYARVADDRTGKALAQRDLHILHLIGRHDDASDGRTFLPGLGRHFAHYFLDEDVPFGLVGRDVRTEDAA